MKGIQNTYHHSYTFSFLLVLILFHPTLSIDVNMLSSSESLTISSNRTLVSPGGAFELGFFKPSALSRWYLGIWYKKVPKKIPGKTYVWVANRDNPLSTSTGTLRISGDNLFLLGLSNHSVWSTNLPRGNVRSPVVAELLANGNFVMRYSNYNDINSSGFLWQSFDFPTDTLLPEMKLGYNLKTGRNRFLTSWRNVDDPTSGDFTYKLDVGRGLPEFFLKEKHFEMQRSGPWNGIEFSGIPEVQGLSYMVYDYTENNEEVAYTFLMSNQSIYSGLRIDDLGYLYRFTWIPPSWVWISSWTLPTDDCDIYESCGPNSYCDLRTSPKCNCVRGFVPKNQTHWDLGEESDGCVRRTPLSCSRNGFSLLKNTKLPDTQMAIVDREIDVKKCKEKCLSDCNCTSFAAVDVRNGGFGCVVWTGELIDIRTYSITGQDLYVKVADIDLVEERDRKGKIIGWSVGASLVLILSVIVFCFWKSRQKKAKAVATPIVNNQVLMNGMVLPRQRNLSRENEVEDLELPFMEFEAVLKATEHFSDCNKVGEGGFGIVYKGSGYISPEYAIEGLFSMKSDVYSFGVCLLEVISGKKNKGFYNSGRDHNLLECVWRNWKEGQGLKIVDTVIIDSSSQTFRPHEILRCLQIGLLCVQARVDDRPLMSAVVLMLGSVAAEIPQPKPPGYCVIGNSLETCSSRSKQPDHESCTVNQITTSIIDAR
ncbi:S-locus glycoprotein domain-containing protein [Hirschfeldia incana]|nr:S-locus glycoprotein domain-containing protein [Hirschfeldia incana]